MGISPTYVSPMLPFWKLRTKVTTAGILCITLAEAKAHLRLPSGASLDDSYIQSLIQVAQDLAQEFTSRKFTTTILNGKADDQLAISPWWSGVITAPSSAVLGPYARGLEIPYPPLQTVEKLAFVGIGGVENILAPSSYIVDNSDPDRIGRVVLKSFASIGNIPQEILSIVCNFTAGYGPIASDVPAAIRQGVLLLVAYLYDNRGACGDSPDGPMMSSGAAALLRPYRVLRV